MGRLIVLEGLDGCGKSTQLERLKSRYGDKVRFISFPNYQSLSGQLVAKYLAGDFPEEDATVGCYTAASLYAVDRYVSYKTSWEDDYKSDKPIIAARYTTSNAIYQMAKLPQRDWDGFIEWLSDHEYNKLGLPRPDLTIYLDMPTDTAQKLLSARYGGNEGKKDIHERDRAFFENCRLAAMYSAEHMGWDIISCAEGGEPLPIDIVGEKIAALTDKFIDI